MKRRILMWIANLLLKRILSNSSVTQRQKDVVFLLNTIIDSIRDHKIDEDELTRIADAFRRLTAKV